jgi:uncharacterized membrane protein
MLTKKEKNLEHKVFEISILLKGINGIIETIGGIFLLIIPVGTITRYVHEFFANEIAGDPTDLIANYVLNYSQTLTHKAEIFAAIYLLIHGVIKIWLIYSIYKNKLWAYPVAGVIFLFFIFYQAYEIFMRHSILLTLITLLDIIILLLLHSEYKRLKRKQIHDIKHST